MWRRSRLLRGGSGASGAMAARLAAALLVLLATVAPTSGDFTVTCPAACKCMWVSGKRQAECTDIGLTRVPSGLSPDIQVLDLSGTDIRELPKDAFRDVGLEHLQKLYLRRSRLARIDRDAFRGLRLLIQLDLSQNAIEKLHEDTFAENEKLRQLLLTGNPLRQLGAFQFPPLAHLQRLDLSHCQLTGIAAKAFANIPSLEKLNLHGNSLSVLELDALQVLTGLKWLTLHGNPWRCDCHLRLLRDWLVERGLYQEDTTCAEPERLVGKSWRAARSEEFACRPAIHLPEPTVVAEPGQNVTLRCQLSGNPPPTTNWVMSGRIISNNTRIPFTGQTYVIREEGTVNRHTSLTITNVNAQDAGQYLCVGVNPGGVVEKNVTLVFPGAGGAAPAPAGPGRPGAAAPGSRLSRPLLLGLVVGSVLLLLLLLLLIVYGCWRRRRGEKAAALGEEPAGAPPISVEHKPDRLGEYEKVPQTDIEMERVRTPAVLTQPRRAASYAGDDRRYSLPDSPLAWDGRRRDYPDLLHLPRRPGRSSPAGSSSSSTQPEQPRLLPQPRLVATPARGLRPGYVTLPRRQRTPSWGSVGRAAAEPIYDSLGPRTTADGSSRLSLSPPGSDTLPPYYVPVEGEPREPPRPRPNGRPHNASADMIEPLREEPEEWDEPGALPPLPQPPAHPPADRPALERPAEPRPPERSRGSPLERPPALERPRKPTPPVAPKPKKMTPPVLPKPQLNGSHVIAFQDEGEDGTEV